MLEVIRAAHELQLLCTAESWRFCLIGGLALQRWGEPRETIDVDLTLLTGFGEEDRFNWTCIRQQLEPLAELKEAPEILGELERRRLEFER